ncbi:unnamed protein product, partial [marine sediment metagenome]
CQSKSELARCLGCESAPVIVKRRAVPINIYSTANLGII